MGYIDERKRRVERKGEEEKGMKWDREWWKRQQIG